MTKVTTWTFPQFDVAKSEDGLEDVVKAIHWRYDMQDGPYSAGAYGTAALDAPNTETFMPYTELTPQWAISVVSAQLNMEELNAALEGQIEKKKNPPVVPMVPPFAALS